MGDLFFLIKMSIYTVIIVIAMQVKIGPTTIEQKVIEFTHHSQLAGNLQQVAQGAASFIGVQYNRVIGHVNSKYIKQHSRDQIPGERLKAKIEDIKASLKRNWKTKKEEAVKEVRSEWNEQMNNASE